MHQTSCQHTTSSVAGDERKEREHHVILAQSKALLIAEELESSIQRRELEPHARLGTRESLQKQFGVARATINEVVKILHDRGRIVAKSGPGGGLFITQPDAGVQMGRFLVSMNQGALSDMAHAIELRDHLEHLLVRHAAEHRTDADVADLWRIYDDLVRAVGDHASLLTSIWRLHQRIADITPNLMLRATYLGAVEYVRSHIDAPVAPEMEPEQKTEFFAQRLEIHRRLIEVIEAGDVDAVDAAVSEHNRT